MPCSSCGHRTLVRHDVTSSLACRDSNTTIQELDSYKAQSFCSHDSIGVKVPVSSTSKQLHNLRMLLLSIRTIN
ncbi:hypothetical protein LINGRAPRIM_LOCUS3426 [Linum grandiflorum]